MATSTLSKPSSTWSSCARTVIRAGAAIAAAIVLIGSLADYWRQVMAALALGFWANIACAALALGVAVVILCRVHKCTTPATEKQVCRREAPAVAVAIGFASLAILLACAQPGDADSVTRWLACAAMWLSAVGAWLGCAITLATAFIPTSE